MMDENSDVLAGRAQRARASLAAESLRHAVPAQPSGQGRAGSRRVLQVVTGLAVVAIVVGFLVAGTWRTRSVVVPNVMTTVSAGSHPVAVVTDGSTVFVADAGPGAVTAIDAKKLSASWSIRDATRPIALALGPDALWVLDAGSSHLLKLDRADGHVIATSQTSLRPLGLAVTGSTVWVLSGGNNTLDRYDAGTVTQNGSVDVPPGAVSVSAGGGYVWVTAPTQVVRVALDANRGTGVLPIPLADRPVAVAATASSTWVALRGGALVDLDAADPSRVVARVATDATPSAVTALDDGSAVVATSAGSLSRITAEGRSSLLPAVGATVASLSSSGSLLVAVSPVTALLYATEVAP